MPATTEIIEALLTEEVLEVSVVEELLDVSIIEETIQVDYCTEVINTEVVEEIIEVEINEEVFEVFVECFGSPAPTPVVGGTGGQVFVTSVTNSGTGIIGNVVYKEHTIPENTIVLEATTDDDTVTVHFLAEGGIDYSPIVTVDGITCTNMQQYPDDRRLFYGSVPLTISTTKVVTVESSTGHHTTVTINRAEGGPQVLSCVIGTYPGVQTAAKAGDYIHVTGTVETSATEIRLEGFGAFDNSGWISISNGVFDITGRVSSRQGTYSAKVIARNGFGTEGDEFTSTNTIVLDQTVPQFVDKGISFPSGQTAFKNTEQGSQRTEVLDFTSLSYSSPNGDFAIDNSTTYEETKVITLTHPQHYNDSAVNFRITAHKVSNDTSNTFNKIIEVADVAPVVTIYQPISRLRSSPTGEIYSISARSDQNLLTAPDIDIPVSGTWTTSAFTGGPKNYTRNLKIVDADANGSGAWTWTSSPPTNRAGLSALISGNEVVGGFLGRTVTIDAWPNRECNIGTRVADVSKLRCENLSKGGTAPHGGTYFTYSSDLTDEINKFTITGPSGTIANDGWLCYNKDLNNATSNTAGTAQVIIEELV
jgi:hypothetical protein